MTLRLTGVIAILFCWGSLAAQNTVYPGDANNNGRVDQYDILPIGYAYGQTGPARIDDTEDQPQLVAVSWDAAFPSGLNYTHADANGNGLVEFLDFVEVATNFGDENPPLSALAFPLGIPGQDASISINNEQDVDPLLAGAVVEVPIVLNFPTDIGAEGINGIAFEINFDHTHFAEYDFTFNADWIASDGEAFRYKRSDPGRIAVALTRFGPDPVFEGGPIGTLSLIIIDDLIGLMEEAPDTMPSVVKVHQVQAFGDGYEPVPVVDDSIALRLYRPGTISPVRSPLNELGSNLYPNPSKGPFMIVSESAFYRMECYDTQGRSFFLFEGEPRRRWEGELHLPAGFYCLRLTGRDGISLLPLILQP